MKLSKIGEFGLINSIRKQVATKDQHVIVGIGDDAAALRIKQKNILITTDMMIENVHFDLSFTTFKQLGHKFLAISVSDIFAMGGDPEYFLVSMGLPNSCPSKNIKSIYSGIMTLARKFNISIIGGDTCASKSELVLSGTLIGTSNGILTRRGARVGDAIFSTSALGDSGMGFYLLKNKKASVRNKSKSRIYSTLINKHLRPTPAPLKSKSRVNSMIDISDGLLIDLCHICDESNVGAVIYKDKIPISNELKAVSKEMNVDPYQFALSGGEDYSLLFTAPPDMKTGAFKIGEITKKGRFIVDECGRKSPFKPEGYEHFKKSNIKYKRSKLIKK